MSSFARSGAGLAVVVASFFVTTVGQQKKPSFPGRIQKVGGAGLSHATVRIEGAGSSETGSQGEFTFTVPKNVTVGFPVIFHVIGWVILKPCELQNGRTYLRDSSVEPVKIIVLPPGDLRLKSIAATESAIGCLIEEEEASQLAPKSESGAAPRSSLSSKRYLPFATQRNRKELVSVAEPSRAAPHPNLVEGAYHPPVAQNSSRSPSQKPSDADPSREEFLAKKAKEFGFSVEELKSAIEAWTRSVRDPYQRGLAALYDGRYVEASQYISESLKTPEGNVLTHYVLLASAEYRQGHYPAAESALRKVLNVHPDDPIVLSNLAVVSEKQAHNSEAAPSQKRTLASDYKALEPDHLYVATSVSNLAQQGITKRSVVLRRDPSRSSPILAHLEKSERVVLVDASLDSGFYHVRTEDDQIGWVISSNITVSPVPENPVPTENPVSPLPPPAGSCEPNLWKRVHHTYRLIVKQQCIEVTGTIVDATASENIRQLDGVRHEQDGDAHGWLKVDPEFENLLDAGNMSNEGGNLVFEIVCRFPATQKDATAACQGYTDKVQLPQVGSRVRISGSYVQDTFHAKWNEIHPVTSITVVQ